MARPGLETSHTWGLTSSKKGTDSSFSTSDCKYSDTRQRKLSTSSFPQVTLVWRRQRWSLASRGAGQPGMYKKGWVPCQLPTLQWKGLINFLLWCFPSASITILVRDLKFLIGKEEQRRQPPCPKESSHPYLLLVESPKG